MTTFKDVLAALKQAWSGFESNEEFRLKLRSFVEKNESVAESENYRDPHVDDLNLLAQILPRATKPTEESTPLVLLILKALKILSRKEINRTQINSSSCAIILQHLDELTPSDVASDAANLLLNLCYEKKNVDLMLALKAVDKLEKALYRKHEDLQTNAAGALQSICFQEAGRCSVREKPCIKRLVYLMTSQSPRVRLRAVGAIHNISSDQKAIHIIRKADGIQRLVKILKHETNDALRGSAAGSLQNLSREAASRLSIMQLGAAPPLISLLSSQDVQASVCAAGALMNTLAVGLSPKQRQQICKMISNTMTLSCLRLSLENLQNILPENKFTKHSLQSSTL